jgi:CxxC motif-containing protein
MKPNRVLASGLHVSIANLSTVPMKRVGGIHKYLHQSQARAIENLLLKNHIRILSH